MRHHQHKVIHCRQGKHLKGFGCRVVLAQLIRASLRGIGFGCEEQRVANSRQPRRRRPLVTSPEVKQPCWLPVLLVAPKLSPRRIVEARHEHLVANHGQVLRREGR